MLANRAANPHPPLLWLAAADAKAPRPHSPTAQLQINTLMGSLGPSLGGTHSTIWMLGFGVQVGDSLSLLVKIDCEGGDSSGRPAR